METESCLAIVGEEEVGVATGMKRMKCSDPRRSP